MNPKKVIAASLVMTHILTIVIVVALYHQWWFLAAVNLVALMMNVFTVVGHFSKLRDPNANLKPVTQIEL